MFKFFKAVKPSKKKADELREEVISQKEEEKLSQNSAILEEKSTEKLEEKSTKNSSEKTDVKSDKKSDTKTTKKISKTVDKLDDAKKIGEFLFENDVIDFAKNAAWQTAGTKKFVGPYSFSVAIDSTTVEHCFFANMRAYPDWQWHVVVSAADEKLTISEVALKPTEKSVSAPKWIPWANRLKPNDLSETDELPYEEDDARLEKSSPAFSKIEANVLSNLAIERNRVLNVYGKAELSSRWYEGTHGPSTASTRIAQANCNSCAFYIPLSGDLGQLFGACANSWSRDDGRVVSADHGCGMHSETDAQSTRRWVEGERVVDDLAQVDIVEATEKLHSENLDTKEDL